MSKVKTPEDIEALLAQPYRRIEAELGMEIRNGQAIMGVRKALEWVRV